MADEIINKEDADVIARVRKILTDEGIVIRTGWAAKSVRVDGGKKVVRIENKLGETTELRVDEIFVACGRRANTENLGLEAAGVKTDRGVHRRRQVPADVRAAHLGLRRRPRRHAVHARRRVRGGEARAQHALSRHARP